MTIVESYRTILSENCEKGLIVMFGGTLHRKRHPLSKAFSPEISKASGPEMLKRNRRILPNPQQLLVEYLTYLERHRGLNVKSCRSHGKRISEFLAYLETENLSLRGVRVEDLDCFMHWIAERSRSRSYLRKRGANLRGFLRYLFAEGWLSEDLSLFVETPRIYRNSSVPPHFTWGEVEQLIASVEGETQEALCDRAMLSLLCAFGLRRGEVARLTLDDVDWKHRVVHIRVRKGGSALTLPLVAAVELALSEYVMRGRPFDGPYRELLLNRFGKPFGENGDEVTKRVKILAKRAGLPGGRGAHSIRRAVGTRLVEQGWGAGAVAKILGHETPDTVRTYLRLSVESLREVADNYGDLL
jgi:site-specific recombinase XerD